MALKVQASFSAGELDPALRERTTFDKYQSGLATSRNERIAKTGRVVSREGRFILKKTKLSGRKCIIYSPPNSGYYIEFGHLYARSYTLAGVLVGSEQSHALTEADLPNVHIETSGIHIYIFCDGKTTLYFNFVTSNFPGFPGVAWVPGYDSSTIAGTGYDLDYCFTLVQNGEESLPSVLAAVGKLPINVGESNILVIQTFTTSSVGQTEIRVYRRPRGGGAFGYVGSTTASVVDGNYTDYTFTDNGQDADYAHSPPKNVIGTGANGSFDDAVYLLSKTGLIYQQRLLLTMGTGAVISGGVNKESVYASRPAYQGDFSRDFPINAASALLFKSGTSGHAQVLRMLDNDGLVVFTTIGIFLSQGELSPTNLALSKKGNWVIDETVPPLAVPGGAIFVDISSNTIRQLAWSFQTGTYQGNELSSFSNHLFLGKKVTSWGFNQGDLPCLTITFDDGTYATLTYEPEQQMNAWTRHDSETFVEQVAATGYPNKMLYLTLSPNGLDRYVEMTVPRFVSGATLEADPQAVMGHSIAAMDSMLSFATCLNDSFVGTDNFTIAPVVAGVWDGPLRITTAGSNVFPSPGLGAVGNILRFFDEDSAAIDLEILTNVGPRDITVQPSETFPLAYASIARLYNTANSFSGLDHLEGEYPAVVVDGFVMCSPNNDIDDYPALQVVSGVLTLPDDYRGAIVHIGRPYTVDTETLDVDTVEQRPVLIESKTTNKVYIKTYNSRGLYVGNTFPADDKVAGMVAVDEMSIDYTEDEEITGNTFEKPETARHELTLPGDWKSQGRVCLRQVDPLHFEILSIIPDLEDMRR